ncbi:hypothetical protein IKU74_04110 [bacterium]|nr:hypothetical protein [bacterium]
MYKNKIMVIFTLMIMVLLCVMIWSSNIVADNEAQKDENPAEPIQIGAPVQPREEVYEEEEYVEEEDDVTGEPYVVNAVAFDPELVVDYRKKKTVSRNFTPQALTADPLIMWNPSSFPLKVYIKNASQLPDLYEEGIISGFKGWETATEGFVKFQFVKSQDGANVVVNVVENAQNCETETCPVGYTFDTSGSKLMRANLYIPQINCEGELLHSRDVYSVVQHGVGHILGITIHSNDNGSVMHKKITYANTNVSDYDASTLKYLYFFKSEVINVPLSQMQNKAMFSKEDAKGLSARDFSDLIIDNIPDIKLSAFDKQIDIAMGYYNKEMYKSAIPAFNKALGMTDDRFEVSFAHKALAMCYMELGDEENTYKHALESYNRLSNIQTSYFLNYVRYQQGKYLEAEVNLQKLILEAPLMKRAYALLALVYVEQGKWAKVKSFSDEIKRKFPTDTPFVLNWIPSTSGNSEGE